MVSYRMLGGKATAYVCERFTCRTPVTDVATMLRQLDAVHAGANSDSS